MNSTAYFTNANAVKHCHFYKIFLLRL